MSVNIQDVAKAAKVSVSTVSRSFTRPELVSEATRSRVLRIADEMSFSISRSATALKSGKALRVALLMSDHIRLWFSASVIEGLNQVLHADGYDLSIFQISSIEERREFFDMLPVRRNADAVIVAFHRCRCAGKRTVGQHRRTNYRHQLCESKRIRFHCGRGDRR